MVFHIDPCLEWSGIWLIRNCFISGKPTQEGPPGASQHGLLSQLLMLFRLSPRRRSRPEGTGEKHLTKMAVSKLLRWRLETESFDALLRAATVFISGSQPGAAQRCSVFRSAKAEVWQPAESAGWCKGKSLKMIKKEALLVLNTGMLWKTMLNLRKTDMMMKRHHDPSCTFRPWYYPGGYCTKAKALLTYDSTSWSYVHAFGLRCQLGLCILEDSGVKWEHCLC